MPDPARVGFPRPPRRSKVLPSGERIFEPTGREVAEMCDDYRWLDKAQEPAPGTPWGEMEPAWQRFYMRHRGVLAWEVDDDD